MGTNRLVRGWSLVAVVALMAATTAGVQAQASEEPVKVAMVIHFIAPNNQEMINGAEVAAEEFGDQAVLTVSGPPQFDEQTQLQMFEAAIASGNQGIAVSTQTPTMWINALNTAVDDGIPVVTFNVGAPESKVDTFVGVNGYDDFYGVGLEVGRQLGSDAAGPIVVGNCFPGTPVLDIRVKGFQDGVLSVAPNVTFEGPFDVRHEPSENYAKWEALANANPDAIAMAGVCNSDPLSLATLKRNNPEYTWLAAGSDLEPGAIEGLEAGNLDVTVTQNSFMQGYVPIRLLLEHLVNGEPFIHGYVPSNFSVITQDNVDTVVDAMKSKEAQAAYYQPFIDEIFPAIYTAPETVVRPIEGLYEGPQE
jgi:ribose transport system substrate-binding protein